MGNGNFWQLFLGKEPYSKKSDFVKAWLLWWAITILALFILSLTTTLNLRSIGIGLSFGGISCNKYCSFSYLNFFQKKINKSVGRLFKRPTHVNS